MTQQEKDIIKGLAKRYSIHGLEFRISGKACVDIEAYTDNRNRLFASDFTERYEFARFIIVFIYRRYIESILEDANSDYDKEFFRLAKCGFATQNDIVDLAKEVSFNISKYAQQ